MAIGTLLAVSNLKSGSEPGGRASAEAPSGGLNIPTIPGLGRLFTAEVPDAQAVDPRAFEESTNWTPVVILAMITVLIVVILFTFLKK